MNILKYITAISIILVSTLPPATITAETIGPGTSCGEAGNTFSTFSTLSPPAIELSASDIDYEYDKLGRLTKVIYGNQQSLAFSYDQGGNITAIRVDQQDSSFTDTDHDGMDDSWEIYHFGDLTTARLYGDFDKDGYADLWEYLNWRDGILDPDGYGFDPRNVNAVGGRGYGIDRSNPSFWIMVLPAILGNSQQ